MSDIAAIVAQARFGLGVRPGGRDPGGSAAGLTDQFARFQPKAPAFAALPELGTMAEAYAAGATGRDADPAARMAARKAFGAEWRETYRRAVNARLAAALNTSAPFVERLVHFWSNHFAVSADNANKGAFAPWFEPQAIRPHVLGRFEDLLVAAVRHPAMLMYLDQTRSVGPGSKLAERAAARPKARRRGLNENLAREILELHTLGVRSGYGQADVTEFARALTGWTVGGMGPGARAGEPGTFAFRPALHEPGRRTVLGRAYDQAGEGQGLAILKDLAAHSATATHVATKLARHFAGDEPPPKLVARLAEAFRGSGGDLPTVYRALADAPEAWVEAPVKFKTPWEWTVSSLRALGRQNAAGLAAPAMLQQLGQPVWKPGSPAGWSDEASAWAAPDALMRRVELAQRLAALPGAPVDARALAPAVLGPSLSPRTAQAIARAESPQAGMVMLLVSPEFLRR